MPYWALVSFIDGVQYVANPSFTLNELLAIITKQVSHNINNKAYGTPSPCIKDHPHWMRSSSLEFQDKTILQFMHLCSLVWEILTNESHTLQCIQQCHHKAKALHVLCTGVGVISFFAVFCPLSLCHWWLLVLFDSGALHAMAHYWPYWWQISCRC